MNDILSEVWGLNEDDKTGGRLFLLGGFVFAGS